MAKRSIKNARKRGIYEWCYIYPHIPRFKVEWRELERLKKELGVK